MRLLAGTLAPAPFRSTLVGDASLSTRPMERVAAPLREMGASVTTTDGHAPVEIVGGPLYGISYALPIPTAQVKGAILLAGVAAEGTTSVVEPAATRDHTERALAALGAPVSFDGTTITVQGVYQHDAFDAAVPGDVSSAAFLVAAAALTGSELTVRGVGLNPSRLHFLRVMERMGVRVELRPTGEELGEPVGDLWVAPGAELRGTEVAASELPLVIDEVPVLALDGHACAWRDLVPGGRGAPGEGERPARRRRRRRPLPRGARGGRGRRPGGAGPRAAQGVPRTAAGTIVWPWRSRSPRSPRTRPARSRGWRPRTCRSPGSSQPCEALGASVEVLT